MNIKALLILFVFIGCGHIIDTSRKKGFKRNPTPKYKLGKKKYIFKDEMGQFVEVHETGKIKNKNQIFLKRNVFLNGNFQNKIVEKSTIYSDIGILKVSGKKVPLMRPKKAFFMVLKDGQKFQSELSVNINSRSIDVKLKSPVEEWNGTQSVPFPSNKGIFCFYTQLIDCLNFTQFVKLAMQKKKGSVPLTLIWDGYPYFQKMYNNIPPELFTKALFEFNGKTKNNIYKFTLDFDNHSIAYHLDNNGNLVGRYWVAQNSELLKK